MTRRAAAPTPVRKGVLWGLAVSSLLLASSSTAVLAQTRARPQTASDSVLVALTVSGGVSLGNYQAGATYAFVHVLRNHEMLLGRMRQAPRSSAVVMDSARRGKLDVLTGASAGNINAFLAAIDYCSTDRTPNPEHSLYWKLWIPMGYGALMPESKKQAALVPGRPVHRPPGETGVFSRTSFSTFFDTLKMQFATRNARGDCATTIGLTTTKFTPATGSIVQGVEYPVQLHAGVFRVIEHDGRLRTVQPRAADVDRANGFNLIVLDPIDAERQGQRRHPVAVGTQYHELALGSVRALAEASGSFPVAFTPREVRYWPLDDLRAGPTTVQPCLPRMAAPLECEQVGAQRFVDGGIFDNRPMGLALALSDAAAGNTTAAALRDSLTTRRDSLIRHVHDRCDLTALAKRPVAAMPVEAAADTVTADSLHLRMLQAELAHIDQQTMALRSELAAASTGCKDVTYQVLVHTFKIDSLTTLPRRMLYYIDEEPLRRSTDSLVYGGAEKYAGLLASLNLAGNVFNTSSNAELRRFDLQLQSRKDVKFDVNTRWAPLMAEHMQHFGAFLAQPFRELDFYIGLYDGLRSGFRVMHCTWERRQADSVRVCEREWTRLALADENGLALSPAGRAVVQRLLHLEDGDGGAPPQANDPRAEVLLALLEANMYVRAHKPDCGVEGMLEQPLCEYGMLRIVERWRSNLGAQWASKMDAAGYRDDFDQAFVRAPVATYNKAVLDVLQRLRAAEGIALADDQAGFPGAIGGALMLQRAYTERFRTCLQPRVRACIDPNPTTADVNRFGRASHFLPHSFTLGGGMGWFAWRPTLYVTNVFSLPWALAIVTPLELQHPRGSSWQGAAGAGLHFVHAGTVMSGVTASWVTTGWEDPGSVDLTFSTMASVLRLGVRFGLNDAPTVGTIGIGDVNGIGWRMLTATTRAVRSALHR